MKSFYKKSIAILTAAVLTASVTVSASAAQIDAQGSSDEGPVYTQSIISVDTEKIFKDWIGYPNPDFGSAYNAGWMYNADKDYMNTTENVGWTGFYNPDINNFSTGTFTFNMKSLNFDPSGFTWGMQTGGTAENPEYSFYAFEECCDSSHWSVAYIDSWKPTADTYSHRGPLYHAVIDAGDDDYSHPDTNGKTGTIGFATGNVLAFGDLPSDCYDAENQVKVVVSESNFEVYINGVLLTTVEAPVVKGSFGPYSVSNPEAYFSKLSFTSSDLTMINAEFDILNKENTITNEVQTGETVTIADNSTFEGSPIVDRLWTVYKDGEAIYSGSTPFTEYTKEAGKYTTTLQVVNEQGVKSNIYATDLIVTEAMVATPDEPTTVAPTETATPAPSATSSVSTVDTATPDTTPTTAPTGTVATNDSQAGMILLSILMGTTIVLIAVHKRKFDI